MDLIYIKYEYFSSKKIVKKYNKQNNFFVEIKRAKEIIHVTVQKSDTCYCLETST